MTSLYEASKIITLIGFLLTTIGVFMPFWFVTEDLHFGVFVGCFRVFKHCESTQKEDVMYKTAKLSDLLWALSLSGMSILLLALLGLCILAKELGNKAIAISVSVLLGIGIALILTAVIVIEDSYVVLGADIGLIMYTNGWAWYLTLVGIVILFTGFICFLLHTCFLICCDDNRVEPVGRNRETNKSSATHIGNEKDAELYEKYNDVIVEDHLRRNLRQPYVNRSVYDERLVDARNNFDWRSF
ncbi:uncharacterized protein LOC132713205 [Ruditapes philippinarum]|uniref:uncharacterized protein LOC132713205 n=1 Tax=Ruditapes philippinarum TaxID=129788 RepID=UPI00295AF64F|nr:uncharacterized protein LOC132713205 [Ruditapes philippinarum]